MRFVIATCLLVCMAGLVGSQDPPKPGPTPPAPTPTPPAPPNPPPQPAPIAPSVSLPADASVKVGRPLHVSIKSSDGVPANYSIDGITGFGADGTPVLAKRGDDYDISEEVNRKAPAGTVSLVFMPFTAGVYTLTASHAKGSDLVSMHITAVVPVPPKPPVPPTPPPEPTPPPGPTPDATLAAKLQTAFTSDAGTPEQKRAWLGSLAAIYSAMPAHIDGLPANATVKDLISDFQSAVASVVPAKTSLANVRGVVRDVLETALGHAPTTALDATSRPKAKAAFQSIAVAIGGVK